MKLAVRTVLDKFLDYATTLYHLHRLYRVEWHGKMMINDKSARFLKTTVVAFSNYYPHIRLRETTKHPSG